MGYKFRKTTIPIVKMKSPPYEGSYEVTENGTLPTEGKLMEQNLVVAIPEYQGSYQVTENGTLPVAGKVMASDLSIATPNTLKTLLDATKRSSSLFTFFSGQSVEGLIRYSDTSEVTVMDSMFSGCRNLESVPLFDTHNVVYMIGMFENCQSLKSVPAFDVSSVSYVGSLFAGCSNLETIHITGMKVSFDISASTKFTREALVEILGNLGSVSTTKTLTMGATNLAKLTSDDIAIATNKGWTLA